MNKVFLIGNLTRDPELSETNSGIPVCRFAIAVNRRFSSQNGEQQTDFFNVTAWRNLAETVARYTRKGNKVAVLGSIQIRNVEDNSGQRRTYVDVVADDVEFLTPKGSSSNSGDDYAPAAPKKKPALENTFIYLIAPDGSMNVYAQSKKINGAAEKIQFPRLGLRFAVAKQFDNVSYFGRGPLANYSDRCYSADVGLYRSKVADWLENFTRPQDTGNREEVRWLALTDDKGVGVRIDSTNGNLPMSVLPYTQQELKGAAHIYQLPPSKGADLRVAWKTCGLGNAACGPNTRPQFNTFFKNSVNWRFAISPLKK